MSKYKIEVNVSMPSCYGSMRNEIVDLIDDWNYSEEEAKEIFKDENKLNDLTSEWAQEHISVNATKLKEN